MKRGDFVTEQELRDNNWMFYTNFANCEVWGQNEERVLWCRDTREIILVYKHTK